MAITSPSMGLKIWNSLLDSYSSSQLADNWAKVDQHDHTEGKGIQIPTGGVADGAITSDKLAYGVFPVRGIVGSTGAIVAGAGFTVTHSTTGKYIIALTTPLVKIPVVQLTPIGAFAIRLESTPTKSEFTVLTTNYSNTAGNTEFHFEAIVS